MPSPSSSSAVPKPWLASSIQEMDRAAMRRGLVGLRVLPPFKVEEESGSLPVIPRAAWLRRLATRRAPGAGHQGFDYQFDYGSFQLHPYGTKHSLPDEHRRTLGKYFAADQLGAEMTELLLLLDMECRIAELVQDTAAHANSAVALKWNNAGSDPAADLAVAKAAFRAQTGGLRPNTLIIGDQTKTDLGMVTKLLSRWPVLVGTQQGMGAVDFTEEQLARLLGFEQVIVAPAMVVSSDPGRTLSYADVWSTAKAVLAFCAKAGDDLTTPALGRELYLPPEGGQAVTKIKQGRDEDRNSDIYFCDAELQEWEIDVDLAYILTGVNA